MVGLMSDVSFADPANRRRRREPLHGVPSMSGVNVMRRGRVEPLLCTPPDLSSSKVGWSGVALESHSIQACVIPRHEHLENFLLVVLEGSTKCEVLTRAKKFEFDAGPGTTFILPRGTVDELRWKGPTRRITVAINEKLLIDAVGESRCERGVELTEHWNLADSNLMAVLLAMRADLDTGSPTGRLYGESLSNALSVYLLKRYAARNYMPTVNQGGLPSYRLKRVHDYIADNLTKDISLAELSAVAGMSSHYFSQLFKIRTGHTPYRYVLLQRIARAKDSLRDPQRSIFEAGLDAGFQNASHFARVFRELTGTTPSRYRSDILT
jgi:AraC family transcriptional regulator